MSIVDLIYDVTPGVSLIAIGSWLLVHAGDDTLRKMRKNISLFLVFFGCVLLVAFTWGTLEPFWSATVTLVEGIIQAELTRQVFLFLFVAVTIGTIVSNIVRIRADKNQGIAATPIVYEESTLGIRIENIGNSPPTCAARLVKLDKIVDVHAETTEAINLNFINPHGHFLGWYRPGSLLSNEVEKEIEKTSTLTLLRMLNDGNGYMIFSNYQNDVPLTGLFEVGVQIERRNYLGKFIPALYIRAAFAVGLDNFGRGFSHWIEDGTIVSTVQ